MARAALQWSLTDLAQSAGVGRATVARFELGEPIAADTRHKIEKALTDAGAAFARKAGRVGVTVPE